MRDGASGSFDMKVEGEGEFWAWFEMKMEVEGGERKMKVWEKKGQFASSEMKM